MNEKDFMLSRLENLSQLWQAYGDLMLKSDHRDREEEAKHAFGIAANYLYSMIIEYEKEVKK
jgi:hypothetical protein